MKILLLTLIICLPACLFGQTSSAVDTLKLGEIFVRSSSKPSVLNGFRDQTIDSTILKDYQLYDISSIISENTPIFVKNYGPGAISTLSFRGTGAGHTQMLWNDITINSPMLGQADLSLVPAGFTDEIRILSGAASMINGSGGLGGTVNFGTRPDWKNESSLLLNAGAGSFGTYGGMMKFRIGTGKFQSVTKAYYNSSLNNFRYINDAGFQAPVAERRKNAAAAMSDLMQEFYIRGDKSVTSASLWYSNADRQLPSNILVTKAQGSETQQDRSFRSIISHDRSVGKISVETSLAWFSTRLLYINRAASIYSDNRSNSIFAKAAAEMSPGKKNRLKIVLNNETDLVNSVNYSDKKSRNITTVSLTDRTQISKNVGFSLLLRDIADNGKFLVPDFSAGMDFLLIEKSSGYLRFNVSRNSKVPSMNDLFWNPGGNPALKNEHSYGGELSFDMKSEIASRFALSPELTFYASSIDDMIQWIPGSSNIWTPENISKVFITGSEAGLGAAGNFGKLSMRLKIRYSLNIARAIDPGGNSGSRQVVYVPEHLLNSSVGIDYADFYATFITDITGKRFTDADNSSYLPAYLINNITAGYRLKTGTSSFNFSMKAINVFNVHYEIIAYYPMPGRSFVISVIYQFIKPL